MANSPIPVSRQDARVRARSGLAAARRFFEGYPGTPGADFHDAERDLEMSLRYLAPGDPMSVDAAFMLGAVRITKHEMRCGWPAGAWRRAEMPEPLAAQAHRLSVRDPFAWAAFTYHGN